MYDILVIIYTVYIYVYKITLTHSCPQNTEYVIHIAHNIDRLFRFTNKGNNLACADTMKK